MFSRRILSISLLLALSSYGVVQAKDSVVGEKTLPAPSKAKVAKTAQPAPAPEVKVETPVTPAPPPEEKKEKKVEAGYKKGFYIQSPDEKWKLVVNSYIQFDFDFEREGGENAFGFRVRRARLALSGNLGTKKLTYKLQVDFVKFKSELLLDAYLDYAAIGESFRIRGGQQTVPWIRQHIISSSNLQFIDRSLAAIEFVNVIEEDSDDDGIPDKFVRNGRDIGIMLHGKHFDNKLEYQAGMFNGSGTNTTNLNNSFLFAGRAVYNIMGQPGYEEGDYDHTEKVALAWGGGGIYNTRDISNDKVTQFGTEAVLKYKGFSAQGEFFYRNKNPGDATLATTNDVGYYAQAGYYAIPKRMEVAVRASQVFLSGFQNDKAEFQLGLSGYPFKKHVKLMTDYSVLPFDTKSGVETSQRWRLRLQTKF